MALHFLTIVHQKLVEVVSNQHPYVNLQEKQQQEEEELRRQEREVKLFASLGAQGVPTFGAEVATFNYYSLC